MKILLVYAPCVGQCFEYQEYSDEPDSSRSYVLVGRHKITEKKKNVLVINAGSFRNNAEKNGGGIDRRKLVKLRHLINDEWKGFVIPF